MSFWGELKRRNVFKVGAAYVIVAWLIVQVANTFFPLLNFPKWAVPMVAVLVILGFPLALLFAWAFELTPEGLKKTEHVPVEESITHVTGKKLDYILIGVIVLAVAFILFDNLYLDRRAIETEVASRVAELTPAAVEEEETLKTIAVLPFADLSPDSDQGYFVDGLSEELLNSLAQIPGLGVTARTSAFSFKETNKTVQEIASILGVDNILEGSVRKAGDALRITAQLIRAADGLHLWSKTYDRQLKDIFEVQEDIATTVANELKVKLGVGESLKQLGGTDNEKAYEYYVIAQGIYDDFTYGGPNHALEYINSAIDIDPKYARAWAFKSTLHNILAAFVPVGLADSNIEDALYAAQKAVDLDSGLSAGYFSQGRTKMVTGDWIGAELAFHKALELSNETLSSDEIHFTALYYVTAGYFKKAVDFLAEWLQNDPLNVSRILYIQGLICLGDYQQAKKELEYARELFGDQWQGIFMYDIMTIRPGIKIPVDPDKTEVTPAEGRILGIAVKNFESPEKGLMELRRIYQDEKDLSLSNFSYISIFAAYLGDSNFAMTAMEKIYDIDSESLQLAWFPVYKEVRQTPRFKKFIRKIGLIDYWEQFGWPDICQPLDNGDFVCN